MPQKDMSSPKTFSEDGPLELQPNIKKYSKGEKNHHSEHREKKYYKKFISEFWYYFLLRWQSQMLIQFFEASKLRCLLSQDHTLLITGS